MMREHYLDHSATTPPCPEACEAMRRAAEEVWGNPSSLHAMGLAAEKTVETARQSVLAALGVKADPLTASQSLLFTSGGTEANNLALSGTAHSKAQYRGKTLVITDCEHASVEETAKSLEKEGFSVVRIPTKGGVYDLDALRQAVGKNTFLVSAMLVNNETGAIFPLAEISRIAKEANPDCLVHCDAVQGFCHVPFSPAALGADLVSVSAHKICGPKGVGALWISPAVLRRKCIVPILYGGQQQGGIRPGTENTVGIAGFGAAASVVRDASGTAELRSYLCEQLRSGRYGSVRINEAPQGNRAPHILSLTVPGIRSETLLHHLTTFGVYVSAGSACSSHSAAPSRALLAFGLSAKDAASTVRLSLGDGNTREDCDAFLTALSSGLAKLSKIR